MEGTSHKLKLTETSKQKEEYKKLKRIENEMKRQEKKEKEIQQEFSRLKELEDKLVEVRKRKELQKQREEQRNRRKKEFLAIGVITRSWKRYKQNKMITNSRNIIYNFLKAKQTKQIVAIAAWASRTIRRFASRVTQKFLQRKYFLMLETLSAQASELAYNSMTDCYLDSIIEDEVSNKVMDILFVEAEQAYKKMMSLDVVSYGIPPSLPASPCNSKPMAVAEDSFFMTEYTNTAPNSEELETIVEQATLPVETGSALRRSGEIVAISEIMKQDSNPLPLRSSLTSINSVTTGQVEPDVQVENAEEIARLRNIFELHQQRIESMNREKERRLRLVQDAKRQHEEMIQRRKNEEKERNMQKEKKKQDFMRELEKKQLEGARIAAKMREEKERLMKIAKEREAKEKEKIAKAREEMMKEKESARRETALMMQHDKPKPSKVKSLAPTPVPPPPPVSTIETSSLTNQVIEPESADVTALTSEPVEGTKCEPVDTENENREKAKKRMLEYIQKEKLRKKLVEDEKLAIEKKKTEVLQRAAVIISRAASAPKTKAPLPVDKVVVDENANPNSQQGPVDPGTNSKPSTSHSTKSGKSSVVSNTSKKNRVNLKGLAASPYFSGADYQALIHKHSIQGSKKRCKKLGKVASLLQLVSKARQRISSDVPSDEPPSSDYISDDMSSVSELSAADASKYALPYTLSSFFSLHKPPTLVFDNCSNIVKVVQESDIAVPACNNADADYEVQLNQECELLRQRLEAKINKEAKDRVINKQMSLAGGVGGGDTPLSNIYNYNINEHNENDDDSLYSGLDSFIYTDNDIDNDSETVYSFFRKDEAGPAVEEEEHTLEPQSNLTYDELVAKEFEELRNKILTNRTTYAAEYND